MFGLLTAPEMLMKGLTKDASSPDVSGQLVTDAWDRITSKQGKGQLLTARDRVFFFFGGYI